MGTLSSLAKFQLSSYTQLGVIAFFSFAIAKSISGNERTISSKYNFSLLLHSAVFDRILYPSSINLFAEQILGKKFAEFLAECVFHPLIEKLCNLENFADFSFQATYGSCDLEAQNVAGSGWFTEDPKEISTK